MLFPSRVGQIAGAHPMGGFMASLVFWVTQDGLVRSCRMKAVHVTSPTFLFFSLR